MNKIFLVTFLYDDDCGILSYSNAFEHLNDAVADAQVAQSEFTDGWDENAFDEEHYQEANGIGLFKCTDDEYNVLEIRIEEKYVR